MEEVEEALRVISCLMKLCKDYDIQRKEAALSIALNEFSLHPWLVWRLLGLKEELLATLAALSASPQPASLLSSPQRAPQSAINQPSLHSAPQSASN